MTGLLSAKHTTEGFSNKPPPLAISAPSDPLIKPNRRPATAKKGQRHRSQSAKIPLTNGHASRPISASNGGQRRNRPISASSASEKKSRPFSASSNRRGSLTSNSSKGSINSKNSISVARRPYSASGSIDKDTESINSQTLSVSVSRKNSAA